MRAACALSCSGGAQRVLLGRVEQRLVGHAAPEQIGESAGQLVRGELEGAVGLCAAHLGAVQEDRRGQHRVDRQAHALVEAAARQLAGEQLHVAVALGRGQRPAKRAQTKALDEAARAAGLRRVAPEQLPFALLDGLLGQRLAQRQLRIHVAAGDRLRGGVVVEAAHARIERQVGHVGAGQEQQLLDGVRRTRAASAGARGADRAAPGRLRTARTPWCRSPLGAHPSRRRSPGVPPAPPSGALRAATFAGLHRAGTGDGGAQPEP